MSQKNHASLAELKIELNTEGNIIITSSNIKPEEFIKAMDNWNAEYENTPTIASLIKYYVGVFDVILKDSKKILS
jgi:hypothetical protein